MTTPLTTVAEIEQSAARVRGTIVRTPLLDVSWLAGRQLRLKAENLQVTGSFKLRGAFNMLARLSPSDRNRGVITYSSGNHAQAVAYAARALGTKAVVVMPVTAPEIKVRGTRRLGAEVLRDGTTSVERRVRAEREASRRGLTIVPPFDHSDIIAGQATVGLEILQDLPGVSCVYVPIGGGGLISGVAAAVRQTRPEVRVVGVEPLGAAKMTASLEAGHPVTLDTVASVADGLLPVRPGDLTFSHVEALVNTVVTVSDDAIERAVRWLFERAKLVVEPSGAAALAAVLASASPDREHMTVAVISGGNIAASSIHEILNRGRKP